MIKMEVVMVVEEIKFKEKHIIALFEEIEEKKPAIFVPYEEELKFEELIEIDFIEMAVAVKHYLEKLPVEEVKKAKALAKKLAKAKAEVLAEEAEYKRYLAERM